MPFGWGIVGFGWVARDFAAPGIVAAGGVVRRVCDPSAEARDAAAVLTSGRVHPGIEPLLADEAVQAIYVATPNHLHRAATEAALRAGKPVLCEKPMAADLADAEAMADAVRRSGRCTAPRSTSATIPPMPRSGTRSATVR